jgi:DNA-binding winged helix-turn-helix (wHTH) protein
MTPDNEPISVDLAREADFELGSLRVRPSLRQVEAEGASETLEPRIMQVLVALSQRRGEVVSRDELIARCWGGRIVGEDAISRCIARVRKLGEAHHAFGLETIARVGYRLTVSGEAADASPSVGGSADTSPIAALSGVPRILRRREVWIGASVLLVAVIAAVFLFRGDRRGPDVDSVVAQLTQQLQNPRDIEQAGAAVEALGSAVRTEERSAFAALSSGDTIHAIDLLEDLATKLEVQGDRESAAEVYTRIGAIALVADQGRGLAARRKAFQLDPKSLPAFQGLFFDTTLLKGPVESIAFADEVLKDASLTPRIRAWVLAHRAAIQTDALRNIPEAETNLREIETLGSGSDDPVFKAVANWVRSMIAFKKDDLGAARELTEAGLEMWPGLPERLSNASEVMMVRILYAQGDWTAAFKLGADVLDRRGRTGDFLPNPMIEVACEAGAFIGEVERAAPFCEAMSNRYDSSFGSESKAYLGLMAAARGDTRKAASEFAAADALVPPDSLISVRVRYFQGWAAMKAGDVEEGERMIEEVVRRAADSQFAASYRSFRANALRLLGEGMIANSQPARSCAPLAEAGRLYAEVGGDAGRAAVDALRGAADCAKPR